MRLWPFGGGRTEQRAGYRDLVVEALLRRAGSGSADPSLTAAVQASAGLWGRSLAAATVTPATPATAAVTAAVLHCIGRDLVLGGESLWLVVMSGGRLRLMRPADFDVSGDPDPETWRYRLTLAGPSNQRTMMAAYDEVIHVRLNETAAQPHRGVSPALAAGDTSSMLAGLEAGLKAEANHTTGYVIPNAAGEGMDDSDFEQLKGDLQKLGGGSRLVPSLGPRAGDPQGRGGDADWRPQRIGLHPPASVVDLRSGAAVAVLAACGIPAALASDRADATALRESLRQLLHVTIAPVARIVQAELARVLEVDVVLDFAGLAASDVQGRARAYRSLRGRVGGLDDAEARRATGLA